MITGPARSPTGEDLIDQAKWADCWICEHIFRRRHKPSVIAPNATEDFVKVSMIRLFDGRLIAECDGLPTSASRVL
jgi:hypothetical protein